MPVDQAKLDKLRAKAPASKAGGARRKKKVVKSSTAMTDDKRIAQQLKKFQCSNLPGIDEVNMFKEDGTVIHFKNPTVKASPSSNTFTISGHNDVKKITEIPGVLNQLGLEGLQGLQAWAKSQGLIDGNMPNPDEMAKQAKKLGLDNVPAANFDEAEADDVE